MTLWTTLMQSLSNIIGFKPGVRINGINGLTGCSPSTRRDLTNVGDRSALWANMAACFQPTLSMCFRLVIRQSETRWSKTRRTDSKQTGLGCVGSVCRRSSWCVSVLSWSKNGIKSFGSSSLKLLVPELWNTQEHVWPVRCCSLWWLLNIVRAAPV